ncbi:DUF2264 domain-containing protein [Cellulomonas denverensis]|uniref:DUF2264 domain-containing protein n=1 Tax=Cellulomonas denverensis TaxID=264297 RepID=A0A7X6KT51_9CELL|nr:DUF2264 domain-containing protein [Cellulomonas denverensis]NKY21523.1 DUF2264 domain-containing protein [Cellulomonas denverensis]GIG25414.1 hypothetical protein Cde04nite_16580 [Cellulomonas denverensis]
MAPQHPHPTSPLTGWDRQRWAALADGMLAAVRPWASPGHARITLPGVEGGYGTAVDGLEGFARTFLLAGFRLAGDHGADPHGYAEWYARGITTGVDPDAADRWVRLDEHPQAKVEAASLALVLDLTRPWIWDRLTPRTQQQLVEYLAVCVGDHGYPRNNWCWFRLVVQTFLRSVGGPSSDQDMADDLALHDSFTRADGWFSDGDERNFDHYVGWALHLYPTLWARMAGAEDLAAGRRERDRAALDRFLTDAVHLVGADGSPLIQGRSLTYRFAAAAPFWVGALAEVPSVTPGLLRRAASGMVDHFGAHGVPDRRGLLTQGWHHEWLPMLQSYSGPGSPYWASKGMLGLALPADHPAWTAVEEPLPVERGDDLHVIGAPAWVVSGTQADGVVRVINHGTDHARPGDQVGDSPLYARLGYSTATWPWLDEGSWRHPTDQSAALVDAAERVSHRAGWTPIAPVLAGEVAVAGSVADAHWIDMPVRQTLHGSGWTGQVQAAGRLTVLSLVRGPWELRLVRVDELADPAAAVTLRLTGWPTVDDDGLTSTLSPVLGSATASTLTRPQVSPMGPGARIPALTYPARPGRWIAALTELSRTRAATGPAALDLTGTVATVTWPDGAATSTDLPIEG